MTHKILKINHFLVSNSPQPVKASMNNIIELRTLRQYKDIIYQHTNAKLVPFKITHCSLQKVKMSHNYLNVDKNA